ncbi:MAG: DUF3795 domain-containing protein [Spirochaetes bacterium]|nr:DUF3795 domain-containing protein [Spirochaetota bacterium]
MKYFNYDSYCGIYCGACDIMHAYQTGHNTAFASFWNESAVKAIHKAVGIPYDDSKPFELACHGCKSDSLFVNCRVCKIRTCAIEKKMDHCIDCGDYPCKLFSDWQKMKALLPHLEQVPVNLESIKKNGVNRWLSEQDQYWKCPECHTGFAWYSSTCANCGHDLKKSAWRFNFIRSGLMKLGLRLSSLMPGKK